MKASGQCKLDPSFVNVKVIHLQGQVDGDNINVSFSEGLVPDNFVVARSYSKQVIRVENLS